MGAWRSRGALGLGLLAAYATTLGLAPGLTGGGPDRGTLEAAWLAGPDDLRAAPGFGLSLLLGPLGTGAAAGLVLAATLALAFVCARELAQGLVPEPWATVGTLALALSPPALDAATTVGPAGPAALLLGGGALLALRAAAAPRLAVGIPAAVLLALVPWLQGLSVLPAAVLAVALQRRLRRRRGYVALLALEVIAFSLVVLVTLDDRLTGRVLPREAQLGGAAGAPLRLLGALADGHHGLLRWAPVALLAGVAAWDVARVRRERLAVALPALAERAAVVVLLGAACVTGLLATALAPAPDGDALVAGTTVAVLPLAVPLVALGLRRAPRAGGALAALTVAGGVALVVAGHVAG